MQWWVEPPAAERAQGSICLFSERKQDVGAGGGARRRKRKPTVNSSGDVGGDGGGGRLL